MCPHTFNSVIRRLVLRIALDISWCMYSTHIAMLKIFDPLPGLCHAPLYLCSNGGCVDSTHQSLAMLLMVLCPEDVSRLRVGKLTAYSVQYLRHLRDFFGTVFKIKPDLETSSVMLSCLGTGYKNLSRSAT
eukprot:TRINITY_DN3150_c0_g1_i2.p1 TRINITY_DN3150_c0_g1~~TRINITY_DN3150_c0_g1_i2.p1  ORF type:complete len:131 (-),score=12.39 TRINITY_DN3150_c0_g1_i2:28-420(-)